MKFVCTQDNLLQGLARVTPLSGKNRQLPILEHVLIKVEDGVLKLIGTDLEVGVEATVAGKLEEEGVVAVPGRTLYDYVQQLPRSVPVTLVLKKDGLLVETEGSTGRLGVVGSDDFPLLPESGDGVSISVSGVLFTEALQRVLFAAAREVSRPEIHAVLVARKEDGVHLAATDSFRLAEEVFELDGEDTTEFAFLLPLPTAAEIVRIFGEEDEVSLLPQDSHITIFSAGGVSLTSRLMEGKYPDYEQIIPNRWDMVAGIDRKEWLRALKTVGVFLPRDSRRVQILMRPGEGLAQLRVAGDGSGEGMVEVACDVDKTTADEMTLLFNINYLTEGLQHVPDEAVELRLGGVADPLLMVPKTGESRYRYVVMPIQA